MTARRCSREASLGVDFAREVEEQRTARAATTDCCEDAVGKG
jgi:hypothetical protein